MSHERVDVLIVVALRQELEAVLDQGSGGRAGWSEARDTTGVTYYVGDEVNARGQSMRLAVAWLGDTGQATATMRSRRLVDELDPACLALCGVCAGFSAAVQLGDVIVAESVFDLSTLEAHAKDPEVDEAGARRVGISYPLDLAWKMNAAELADDAAFSAELSRSRPPSLEAQVHLLARALFDEENGAVSALQHADRAERWPDWSDAVERLLSLRAAGIGSNGELMLEDSGRYAVQRQKLVYPDGLPGDRPFRVHLGALATAPKILGDPDVLGNQAARVRRLLGADLESTAIASVAEHLGRRWLVVRGVSDYLDPDRYGSLFDFARLASAKFLMTFLRRYFDVEARAKPPSDRPEEQIVEPMLVERLTIKGFKNISEIDLDLAAGSKLDGRWTCLAGINGSGKTSILQAIALALLGDRLSEQLGSVRLARMVRRIGDAAELAEITATVRVGAEVQTLSLPLSTEGIDSARLAAYPNLKEMRELWKKRAGRGILASYGASRNLSEYLDNRHESLHVEVQRQMTLFDPLARVARADLLLSDDPQIAPVVRTLRRLFEVVFADLPLAVAPEEGSLRFEVDGAVLPASALPDGFRSSIAWLGDLCALWHEKARPEDIADGDPKHIHGIVLVDEIDLHLHPSLQRVLVPRLREAMPHVQWIVTTHSPLVLASFDRREIKMLDSSEPGGVRELDRDILGFTTDQIYERLMDTKPRGVVLEEMLAEADSTAMDPARREELAVLVATAPDFNEAEAKQRVAWRQDLIARLRQGESPGSEKKG